MGNRQADAKPKSPAEKSASSASQVEHKERAPVMYFSPATHPQKELLFTALHVRAVQHVERLVEPENHDKLEAWRAKHGADPVPSVPEQKRIAWAHDSYVDLIKLIPQTEASVHKVIEIYSKEVREFNEEAERSGSGFMEQLNGDWGLHED